MTCSSKAMQWFHDGGRWQVYRVLTFLQRVNYAHTRRPPIWANLRFQKSTLALQALPSIILCHMLQP